MTQPNFIVTPQTKTNMTTLTEFTKVRDIIKREKNLILSQESDLNPNFQKVGSRHNRSSSPIDNARQLLDCIETCRTNVAAESSVLTNVLKVKQ